jgi:hypothetical protein
MEVKAYTGGMKIDNQVLSEIQETVLDLRNTELWCIGARITQHTTKSEESLDNLADAIYRDCKAAFKRVEQYDKDLDKLTKAREAIGNLRYTYLGIY